jgi:clan AA aspartic protease (TIGR02281 family)
MKNPDNFGAVSVAVYAVVILSGCSAVSTTGKVVSGVGKAGWVTARSAGKIALETGKVVRKGTRTAVYMVRGRQIVPLERRGNSLYAGVRLNRRVDGRFLVDTGASSMQISRAMARRLGIKLSRAEAAQVVLAGGYRVAAYRVRLREVRVGGARVSNVEAIVLKDDNLGMTDGLIGMSFLDNFDFQINPQKPELVLQQKAI